MAASRRAMVLVDLPLARWIAEIGAEIVGGRGGQFFSAAVQMAVQIFQIAAVGVDGIVGQPALWGEVIQQQAKLRGSAGCLGGAASACGEVHAAAACWVRRRTELTVTWAGLVRTVRLAYTTLGVNPACSAFRWPLQASSCSSQASRPRRSPSISW